MKTGVCYNATGTVLSLLILPAISRGLAQELRDASALSRLSPVQW